MSRQVHLAVTEAFLGMQTLRCSDADDMINELNALEGAQVTLEQQITQSNLFLAKLGRSVTKQRHIRTEEWILVSSSTSSGQSDKTRSALSEEKVEKLLNNLFVKDRYYVLTPKILAGRSLSERDVELFADEGYLDKTEDGRVYPSTKLLVDAGKYLESKFSGALSACAGCKQLQIFGYFCSDLSCTFRVHRRCYQPYYQKESCELGQCPACHAAMDPPNNDI